MAKKNRIVSFNKMEPELLNLVRKTFPLGYEEMIKLFNLGVGRSFYAFDLITEECNYLIKVDVDVDFSVIGNDDEATKD
jgi:phosphoribosylaminoimidazole (AIR) synthetase